MRRASRQQPAGISIHALLAESDHAPNRHPCPRSRNFYPRSPCGERLSVTSIFMVISSNFYPRSPCGERPVTSVARVATTVISIHALLAESDHKDLTQWFRNYDFYPRSPCGERPGYCGGNPAAFGISIHALLAESDEPTTSRNNKNNVFLSTLSLRRATLMRYRIKAR